VLAGACPERGVFGRHIPPPPVVALADDGITQVCNFGPGFIVGFENGLVREIGPGGGNLPGADSPVSKVVVAPEYIAAGTITGAVVVGSWHDGQVKALQSDDADPHTGKINDMHAVGFCLGVASEDGSASVWDVQTGTRIALLRGHEEPVTCIRCIKGHNAFVDTIATGSMDSTIKLWDLASGECVATLEKHGEMITAFDLVGDRLFTAGLDGIAVWNASEGKCLHHNEKGGEVSLMKVVGNVIIVARSARKMDARTEIVVFDWEKGRELSQLYIGGLVATCLDVSPNRVTAVLKEPDSSKATVLVWDFGAGTFGMPPAIAPAPAR